MKYAVLSDIHANLEALKRVLADAAACGAERIVCLGDIVGYGPRPAEALALLRAQANAVILAGNHDDAVSGRGDAAAFIDLAGDAVQRHREALSSDARDWLKRLPHTAAIEGALCTHGDICDPPKFYYVAEEDDAIANFNASDAQLIFVGHTHVPCLFLVGNSGTVYKTAPQDFTLEADKRYIVNPGSVGYPRESNGQCYSSYILYDASEHTVTYRFLPFSVASVMQRGTNPKRTRKIVIAGIAALAALAAGISAFLLTPKTRVADDPALFLDTRTLPLESDLKHVRANLELAKGSRPVQLRITFLNADQTPLGTESLTVKKSSTREIKIPAGARQAVLTTQKIKADDQPRILSFAPTTSVK